MKKFYKLFFMFLLIVFMIPSSAFGENYFLYDFEKGSIWHMGENSTEFIEKMAIEKNPDLLMETSIPNKFIAIYTPEEKVKKKGENIPGQLTVFNVETNRTEDIIELGYYPFRWDYTKDHQHFFISYRVAPDEDVFEVLHYNVADQTVEKLKFASENIYDLALSHNQDQLFVITSGKKIVPQLFVLSYNPLKIQQSILAGKNPDRLYILGENRIALLDWDRQKDQDGSVKVIDTNSYTVVKEHVFKPMNVYTQWFEDEKILILVTGNIKMGSFGLKGEGDFLKITADQFIVNHTEKPWLDFEYLVDKNRLYVLYESKLEIIDYHNSTSQVIKTGTNTYSTSGYIHLFQFKRLPDMEMAVIYCMRSGNFKFFDLGTNIILSDVKCGKSRFLASLFEIDAKAVINVNAEKNKYYILNRATKDITILESDFKKKEFIDFSESPLNMYQVQKPNLLTLVTTNKKMYKLDYQSNALTTVHEFAEEVKYTYFYEDNNRLIVLSDKELLVLDTKTLEIKNKFLLYGNPNEKYSKVIPGSLRYYFIRAL